MFKKVLRLFGGKFAEEEPIKYKKQEKKLINRVVLCGESTQCKSVMWRNILCEHITEIDPSLSEHSKTFITQES